MLHEIVLSAAFLAGVVTFFSPCSIALLPAYISYYLGRPAETGAVPVGSGTSRKGLLRSILLAVGGGVLLTFGFVRPYVEVLGGSFEYGVVEFVAIGLGTAILVVSAYRVGQYLEEVPRAEVDTLRSGVLRGVGFGLTTTLGFFTFFVLVGILVILGASAIATVLPQVAFVMAAFLLVVGVLMFTDVNVSFVPKVIAPRGRGFLSFFAFGIGYATISAGCLLPVFGAILVNVVAVTTTGDIALSLSILAAYGAGMGTLMVVFSIYVAVTKQTSIQYLRRILPAVKKVSGVIVIAMAAFILWYDWTFFLAP
ncbi:MAG: cytochrome c biogenesis protein CcdA [Thermoplasmata archaeon]